MQLTATITDTTYHHRCLGVRYGYVNVFFTRTRTHADYIDLTTRQNTNEHQTAKTSLRDHGLNYLQKNPRDENLAIKAILTITQMLMRIGGVK